MSDFDKEAEREKLRKKYERDEQERKATQRMSDLLLKGATMTNTHCGTCGDPLFQQDGTTFCPSCHGNPDAVQGTGLEARPAEESADETTDESNAETVDRNPDTDASSDSPDEGTVADVAGADAPPTDTAERQWDRPSDSSAAVDADSRGSSEASGPTDADDGRPSARPAQSRSAASGRGDSSRTPGNDRSDRGDRGPRDRRLSSRHAAGDLEAAYASLVEAVEKFAGEAAATDDPRYARECLEAAHEASETLETLR